MHPRRARRSVAAALAGFLALVAAGCAQGDMAAVTPRPPASPPAVSTAVPASPTAATGRRVVTASMALRLPAGFRSAGRSGAAQIFDSADACASILVSDGPSPELPLANLLWKFESQDGLWTSPPERLPDQTVAGAAWFHLHGWGKAHNASDDVNVFGSYRAGSTVALMFVRNLLNDCGIPRPDIDAQWASVLSTVGWR